MSSLDRMAALGVASLAAALLSLPAAAQEPEEPLGDLLEIIPLPEEKPAAEATPPPRKPAPAPAPIVRPGNVLSVDLPPSAATGEISTPDESQTEADPSAEGQTAAEADAAAIADAAWAALQEQRREAVNAVESPIVARLNAEMAARAAEAGRRFAADQEAYERSLVEHEELVRRRQAEHATETEAHARRVAREQAEYRARVEACLAGDRRACDR
jgi:colicin import membrane protein